MTNQEAMKQALDFLRSGHFTYPTKIADDLEEALAKQEQGEPVGVMVSMDVSKGDEPEHRIFGRIYEVQEDSDGVTYLTIEESRNFEAKQEQGEPVALETVYETIIHWDEGGGKRSRRELARRIVALYTNPQPKAEKQEPVAWMYEYWDDHHDASTAGKWRKNMTCLPLDLSNCKNVQPLYTTPQQRTWVGLTDEDLAVCGDEDDVLLARYWERVCKEKNT